MKTKLIKIPDDVFAKIQEEAKKQNRDVMKQINYILKLFVDGK